MRRNNMPRGGFGSGQGGPLVTDHVELRDLDLELELLKRKREMIQQQQQLLVSEQQLSNRQRQYSYEYDQPRQMYQGQQQQYNSSQNFSQRYEPSPPIQPFNDYSGSLLGKRSGDDNWRPNYAPKRSSVPQSGSKRSFGAGADLRAQGLHDRPTQASKQQGSSSSSHYAQSKTQNRPKPWIQPPPLMGKLIPPSQRFNNPKPHTPSRFKDYAPRQSRRDFKPTKVTKPKPLPSASVGKLVSYPIPIRKGFVEAAKSAQKDVDSSERSNFILRKNKVPSQQLVGRLELCLGTVLKDVKNQFGNIEKHKHIFLSQNLMRLMKKAIRERVRNVMMDKYVGKVTSVVEEYRKVFPVETDVEILNVALEHFASNKQLVIRLDDEETPEIYFKNNMTKLLNTVLEDMFEKVKHMYENVSEEGISNTFFEILKENEEDFTKDVQENAAADTSVPEQNEITAKDNVIKTEETENGNIQESNEIAVIEDDLEAKTAINETGSENVDANDEEDKLNENEIKGEIKSDILDTSALDEVAEKKPPGKSEDAKKKLIKLEVMSTALIRRRLGALLPKFKSNILTILNVNEMYNDTKKAILSQLENKLSIVQRVEEAKKTKKSPVVSVNTLTPTAKAKEPSILPHFVKIQGHPYLPKRKVMQVFLKKYHPKSIKKHRNLPLLFVGFSNKEDYDQMLAIKETEIGNVTISIKVSEKPLTNSAKDNFFKSTSFDDDDLQLVQKNSETLANSSDVINSDLDDQINDLLTSIRKEEESDPNKSAEEPIVETAEVPTETNDDVAVENDNATEEIQDENNVENCEANSVETDAQAEEAEGAPVENEDVGNKMETDVSEKIAKEEVHDVVEEIKTETKETGKATPTRMSARNANVTPSTVRTRRASRLPQN